MSGLKIREVVAKMGTIGLARSNRFVIEFGGSVPLPTAEANRRFAFMCSGIVIPSKSFATAEVSHSAGPAHLVPYNRIVKNQVTISFHVGKDLFERLFFEVWQNKIQNYKTNSFKFPDSYQCEVNLYQLDEANELLYATKLTRAYPSEIGELSYSGEKDATLTQTITFACEKSQYGIARKTGSVDMGAGIVWEGDTDEPNLGVIDPNVESGNAKDFGFMGHLVEAVASAGSVLLKKHKTPADWLSAGSVLLAQGTPDYYNSLNLLDLILGGKGNEKIDVPGSPVLTIPGI